MMKLSIDYHKNMFSVHWNNNAYSMHIQCVLNAHQMFILPPNKHVHFPNYTKKLKCQDLSFNTNHNVMLKAPKVLLQRNNIYIVFL